MITHHDKMRIAVESKLSYGTVEKWTKGGVVTNANLEAIKRAMSKLKIRRFGEKKTQGQQ